MPPPILAPAPSRFRFTRTPNDIIDSGILDTLSLCATRVHRWLERLANRDGRAWPGLEWLADKVHYCRRSVWSAIRQLCRAGLVEICRRGRNGASSVYQLLIPEPPPQISTAPLPLFEDTVQTPQRANGAQAPKTGKPRANSSRRDTYSEIGQNDTRAMRLHPNKICEQDTATGNAVVAFLKSVGLDAAWVDANAARWTVEEVKQARDYASKRAKGGFCGYLRRVLEGGWWKKVIKQAAAPAPQAPNLPVQATARKPQDAPATTDGLPVIPDPDALKRLPEASQRFFTRYQSRKGVKTLIPRETPGQSVPPRPVPLPSP